MARLVQCTALLLVLHSAISATVNLLSVLPDHHETEMCLTQEKRDGAIQSIKASAQIATSNLEASLNCGAGLWYLIAHLNMSDPSQQCPSTWTENSTSGVRTCGRPVTSSGSCPATFYSTSCRYSRVCGRVIGYQYGSTEAFSHQAVATIDSYYVYGVSVTHGAPRNHIWTFAAGVSEGGYTTDQGWNCPCSNSNHQDNVFPPSFVGDNYYCESGNPKNYYSIHHLYSTDPLWDGQQCEGECCSNGKSPPWFSVELPNPTSDDIEVRICVPQGSHDDIEIQLLELYVSE